MDVFVPNVGEVIGGRQREENYELLKERILEMGLPYEGYLDLRRYGTVKHSGLGNGMVFDDGNGYNPEYMYGNYFDRMRIVAGKTNEEAAVVKGNGDKEHKTMSFGFKEQVRILMRSSDGIMLSRGNLAIHLPPEKFAGALISESVSS